jgi:restriction system protein
VIPIYKKIMSPLLEFCSKIIGQDVELSRIITEIEDVFGLTSEEREMLLSSETWVVANRVGWAKMNLLKEGLLESRIRGFV